MTGNHGKLFRLERAETIQRNDRGGALPYLSQTTDGWTLAGRRAHQIANMNYTARELAREERRERRDRIESAAAVIKEQRGL